MPTFPENAMESISGLYVEIRFLISKYQFYFYDYLQILQEYGINVLLHYIINHLESNCLYTKYNTGCGI